MLGLNLANGPVVSSAVVALVVVGGGCCEEGGIAAWKRPWSSSIVDYWFSLSTRDCTFSTSDCTFSIRDAEKVQSLVEKVQSLVENLKKIWHPYSLLIHTMASATASRYRQQHHQKNRPTHRTSPPPTTWQTTTPSHPPPPQHIWLKSTRDCTHIFILHPIVSIIMNSNVVGVDWMFTTSGGELSVEESGIVGIDWWWWWRYWSMRCHLFWSGRLPISYNILICTLSVECLGLKRRLMI